MWDLVRSEWGFLVIIVQLKIHKMGRSPLDTLEAFSMAMIENDVMYNTKLAFVHGINE
jgi:hypothetical protein